MDRIREPEIEPEHKCSNCKFAVRNEYAHENPLADVSCHRHAPLVTGGMMSSTETVWPSVGPDNWCGDFEHKF